jgi:hypothetical protein
MQSILRWTLVTGVLAVALGLPAPAQALFGGTLTASQCVVGKVRCLTKLKSCLLTCHGKALKAGTAVDPTCVAKCRDKFDLAPAVPEKGCFAKLEAKGGCGVSVGDSATLAAKVDAHVQDAVAQLTPAGGTPSNKCTAGKIGCLRKYDTCVLTLVRKAAAAGTAIADLSKCQHYLAIDAKSCFNKLEAKYCSFGCSSGPACLTFGDATELRQQDDAFVDDLITAFETGPNDIDNQRCNGDTSVPCTSAPGGVAGCGGPLGTCEFYFGSYRPYIASGIAICVSTQWNGAITGTFDQATGASAGVAAAISRAYNGISLESPCPRCVGDLFPNDGSPAGTCSGGSRNGLPCDGNGVSSEPTFGTTSLDCPPGAVVATFALDLSNSTDTMTKTVTASSPICNGAAGKKCLCATCSLNSSIGCDHDADCAAVAAGTCTNNAGEPRKPNVCVDDTSTPADETVCVPTGRGEGHCAAGPPLGHCAIETFRNCLLQTHCPLDGDTCVETLRECFPGYDGNVGDTVTATGNRAVFRNGAATLGLATVYCVAASESPIANSFSGFPGPARMQLAGIGEDDGGPGCPTHASFMPTAKGSTIDVGWTGILHDQRMIGQAKVTVATTCTGTYPSCACSYTGPIPNPNVN